MDIIITKNFYESSARAAQKFIQLMQRKPDAQLGLATGGSAEGIYAELVAAYKAQKIDFSQASSINLDEYVGLDGNHKQSYRHYMDQHFFNHINIKKERAYVPDGKADPASELQLFRNKLHSRPVDLQLLGVGISGHIGFNEPNAQLVADAHIENLLESTITANARYFSSPREVPHQAFTQGVGDILQAREIVLIACGEAKAAAMRELLTHNIVTTQWPVTLLKLHPAVTVVIDEALALAAGYRQTSDSAGV